MNAFSPSIGVSSSIIRVLIVDDHAAIREALKASIETKLDMSVVGEAASAEQALQLVEEVRPHVMVVDISLEDVHGLDLVKHLRDRYEDVHIIVFSMYDEQVYAERAVRAGASGYLMKSETTQSVIDAIRAAHRGDMYLSRAMARRILANPATYTAHQPGFAIDELTERERLVFEMLGRGCSTIEIAETLDLQIKTVETYRRRAKEKLGLDSVGELLQYAVRWSQG